MLNYYDEENENETQNAAKRLKKSNSFAKIVQDELNEDLVNFKSKELIGIQVFCLISSSYYTVE